MPGLSNRNPVSGYGGIGKVHIKYKPKPVKRFAYGFVIYMICVGLLIFQVTWVNNTSRYMITLPVMRFILSSFEYFRKSGITSSHTASFVQSTVEVNQNSDGVYTIKGESISDVLYTQGYVHAQNRLFQMEILRRKAEGKLAEVKGSAALQSDKFARILNITGLAEIDLSAQSEEELGYLISYSSGVNAYINEYSSKPLEFLTFDIDPLPWQPLHTLEILRYHSFAATECWEDILSQFILSNFLKTDLTDFLFADNHLSPNTKSSSSHTGTVLAVSGKHTMSGKPSLLSNIITDVSNISQLSLILFTYLILFSSG
jgi:acyl-homoserine lactone acylase PvdQ